MNWRGRPLTSHQVIVAAIAATTTGTGLTVRAELDTGTYPPGVPVSDEQMAALPLTRRDWNYTLHPRPPAPPPRSAPRPGRGERPGWAHPCLTGMTAAGWDQLTAALALPYQAQREAEMHMPLLKRAGHRIEPTATRLTTLADITAYGSVHGITLTPKTKPAR
jgi:hypothetical protein